MTYISAYLNFNGRCREAMEFYRECLGAELTLQTVEGSAMESQCPSAMGHYILHGTLQKNCLLLMGSDMTGPDGFYQGNNMALSLSCSSEKEISDFYTKLSDGGQVIHQLRTECWGAIFGVFNDRFGIRWMLNYDRASSPKNE
ncbi:VOC family protein [Sediminibacterium soli]|uniref:VOC family protein n=1 Tax=Sediminibacterium soli TaxID=2698829 RepID=UPI00137B5DA5|nr:VOC family protein [Sediminibacterium soli]NCI45220.1 VOC family protein [Sediminibacterium soli]